MVLAGGFGVVATVMGLRILWRADESLRGQTTSASLFLSGEKAVGGVPEELGGAGRTPRAGFQATGDPGRSQGRDHDRWAWSGTTYREGEVTSGGGRSGRGEVGLGAWPGAVALGCTHLASGRGPGLLLLTALNTYVAGTTRKDDAVFS